MKTYNGFRVPEDYGDIAFLSVNAPTFLLPHTSSNHSLGPGINMADVITGKITMAEVTHLCEEAIDRYLEEFG